MRRGQPPVCVDIRHQDFAGTRGEMNTSGGMSQSGPRTFLVTGPSQECVCGVHYGVAPVQGRPPTGAHRLIAGHSQYPQDVGPPIFDGAADLLQQ